MLTRASGLDLYIHARSPTGGKISWYFYRSYGLTVGDADLTDFEKTNFFSFLVHLVHFWYIWLTNKHKFVPRIKVWKLRDPGKQAELSEVFKAKTLESELSQTSTVDERWTSLKDKLLQATKQVCSVSSNHPWRKQTWWWNSQVEEAVREKRRCKRTSNRAVHQARSEAEKVALQKIDPRSGDVYRLAKQMRRDNQDVIGEKPVKNDPGQLSLDEEAKKEAVREHYERLLNVEFPWNPEDLSEESPVEGPSEPITLEMITKAISKTASGKTA